MYSSHRGVVGLVVFIVGFTAGVTFASLYYLQRIEAVTNKVNIKLNDQYIVAEVAKDESSREKGLSGRDSIGLNEGMYFIFDAPASYSFWMKGMKFPIDIVWISNGKIVGFEENMQPPADPNLPDGQLKEYFPPAPVDRVLELHAGRVRLLKSGVGDEILVKPLVSVQQPASQQY
jgi:uncharacterized membrane protein (UPF0127 family)